MPVFEFETPRGTFEVEAPDQQAAMQAMGLQAPMSMGDKVQGLGVSALSGQTLGFGDEITGLGRAALDYLTPPAEGVAQDSQSFGERYRMFRDDARQAQSDVRGEHPALAYGTEVAAGIPTVFGPGATAAQRGLAARYGTAAGFGGTAGAGYSEGDTIDRILLDTGLGAGMGVVAEPVTRILGNIVKTAYGKYGEKPARAVAKELKRLAKASGKPIVEIIDGIRSGKVMAENDTLTAIIRSMRSMGGEAAEDITNQVKGRRDMTRARALRGLQDQLAPDLDDPNVYRAMTRTDEILGDLESDAYTEVFNRHTGDLPKPISDTVQEAVRSVPEVASEMSRLYRAQNIVPLFRTMDDGAIELVRIPTLRDAEQVRRVLRDTASGDFRAGKGTVGGAIGKIRTALQNQLDEYAPDLAAARAAAATRRQTRDAFAEGRKALNKPVDEIVVMLEDYKRQGPEVVAAFRAGAADAVRNRSNRSANIMTRISDPDRQEGAVLRQLLPEGPQSDTLNLANVASGAEESRNKILHNSMTAPQEAASEFLEGFNKHSLLARAADTVRRKLSTNYPDLTERQQQEVVEYLYSTNADEVNRVLSGAYPFDELINRIAARTRTGMSAAGSAALNAGGQ